MLLINVCVIVVALLVPPPYRWMYSTCILLLCLYLLRRKRWCALIFIGISLVSLSYHLVWQVPLPAAANPLIIQWYPSDACFIELEGDSLTRVLIKANQRDVYVKPCVVKPQQSQAFVIKVTGAQLKGRRLAQVAYGKGVDAAGYAPRGYHSLAPLTTADRILSAYSSWRFAFSIIKGERGRWDERDRWWVNYLGITHLFVVSGLHVGFVCVLAVLAVRAFWWLCPSVSALCRRRVGLEWCCAVPACIAYAIWSGAGEPAVRAAIMAVCFLSVRLMFHKIPLLQVLLLCAWIMLMLWPGRIINPSFWLSFGFVGLLVLCVSKLPNVGKALYLQGLLSIFALLFTLGWQSQLSVLTVMINLVLVPFVAFFWFPVSLIAWLEASVLRSDWLYGGVDALLVWVFSWLQPLLYEAPSVLIKADIGSGFKLVSIVLALAGVAWLPLIRGWLLVLGVALSVCVLPFSTHPDWIWQRFGDQFVEIRPSATSLNMLPIDVREVDRVVGVFNPKGKNLAHQALKENWQFALLTSDAEAKALLESLQVKTLDILEGEQIYVSFDRGYWQVRSSACYELLNLLKTVACEHAESLESVLN